MTLRRLFSCLLLALAFVASVAGRHPAAAVPPDSAAATMSLEAGDPLGPSPYLGVSAYSGATAGVEAALDARTVVRPTRISLLRQVSSLPEAATLSRIRWALLNLSEVSPDLTAARTGQRSARTTTLPPPLDS